MNIKQINQPVTFKLDDKIVQLIRPCIKEKEYKNYSLILDNFVREVDISCCGMFYNFNQEFYYHHTALEDCKMRKFKINPNAALLHLDRIFHRIDKLENRGWKNISEKNDMNKMLDKKINSSV